MWNVHRYVFHFLRRGSTKCINERVTTTSPTGFGVVSHVALLVISFCRGLSFRSWSSDWQTPSLGCLRICLHGRCDLPTFDMFGSSHIFFSSALVESEVSLQGKKVRSIHSVRSGCIISLDASIRGRRSCQKFTLRSVTYGISSRSPRDDGSNSTNHLLICTGYHSHIPPLLIFRFISYILRAGFFLVTRRSSVVRGTLSLDDRVFTLCAPDTGNRMPDSFVLVFVCGRGARPLGAGCLILFSWLFVHLLA